MERLTVLPLQNGRPYETRPSGLTEYRVRHEDNTESNDSIFIDYVHADWAHDTIRVEGYINDGTRNRGVIGYYQPEPPDSDSDLGVLEIQDA